MAIMPGKAASRASIAEKMPALSADIQQIFLEHRQVYGSPRIHAVLKARGIPVRASGSCG